MAKLNPRFADDREEIARVFGWTAAWRACITQIKKDMAQAASHRYALSIELSKAEAALQWHEDIAAIAADEEVVALTPVKPTSHLYVLREAELGIISEATFDPQTAAFWRRELSHYTVETQPTATDTEINQVEALNEWLLRHYNEGAHWVYETTDTATHVANIREQGYAQYKLSLARHWQVVQDYADDIRNA